MLFPRSSLGTRYGLALDNTVGIIDADYYEADNEGHILIQLTNHSREQKLQLQQAAAYVQGIFLPFALRKDERCRQKAHWRIRQHRILAGMSCFFFRISSVFLSFFENSFLVLAVRIKKRKD